MTLVAALSLSLVCLSPAHGCSLYVNLCARVCIPIYRYVDSVWWSMFVHDFSCPQYMAFTIFCLLVSFYTKGSEFKLWLLNVYIYYGSNHYSSWDTGMQLMEWLHDVLQSRQYGNNTHFIINNLLIMHLKSCKTCSRVSFPFYRLFAFANRYVQLLFYYIADQFSNFSITILLTIFISIWCHGINSLCVSF